MDYTRRELVSGLAAAGTASFLGMRPETASAEPPPETTRLRLAKARTLCWAPQYVAEEFLRAEGFSEVAYVPVAGGRMAQLLADGRADLAMEFVGPNIISLDQGVPALFLAGVHIGCFEVFGSGSVRRIGDLKGRTVAVGALNGPQHVFLASMAAYVGLDPRKDITWLALPPAESIRRLAEGEIDAFLGFPPTPQELRAKRIGHVVLNSTTDRPWSQYFCCVVTAAPEFVRKHPVATKRALRSILKGADVCALQPERAAQALIEQGLTDQYQTALQVMKELPYSRWREFDPEDTVRFYALRLHEAGMIKSTPQKIIAQGTDWRFLNELKKELKG